MALGYLSACLLIALQFQALKMMSLFHYNKIITIFREDSGSGGYGSQETLVLPNSLPLKIRSTRLK